jgi:hypothetical protein
MPAVNGGRGMGELGGRGLHKLARYPASLASRLLQGVLH